MTDDLRTILADLTTGEPPQDLGVRALAAGNRRRLRGRMLTGAATVALVAVVAIPTAALRHGTTTVGATPTAPRFALLSFEQYTNDPHDPWYAWDRESHRYVTVPYSIEPSPDGAWAILQDDKNRWALARWANAVHGRDLHWRPRTDHELLAWTNTGATVVRVNAVRRTNTYLDAASQQAQVAHWPAELSPGKPLEFAGVARGDQTVFVLLSTDTEVLVDRHGQVTGTSTVPTTGPPVPTGKLKTGPRHPYYGLMVSASGTAVSPDGRYVANFGSVTDYQDHRRITFGAASGLIDGGFVASWYDNTHVVQTSRGESGQPITMSIHDVTGRALASLPLTMLPRAGVGRTDARLVPLGAGDEGAVTISL